MRRPSPTASPRASDDEGGDEDDYPSPTASPHASDDEGGNEKKCENMAQVGGGYITWYLAGCFLYCR